MSIRSNGTKRDTKRILSALFLLFVAIACTAVAARRGFPLSWDVIAGAVYFLAFCMFRSANEV